MTRQGVAMGVWLALATGAPAFAAGGAQLVDDASVETPGTCHLETWITTYGAGRGLVNLSPACTREALHRLELDAGVQYLRDHPDDAVAGPAFKLNLISNDRAVGLALTGAAGWSVHQGRLATASVVAPLSWTLGYQTQINFNAGWMYARGARRRNDAIYGAQVNRSLGDHLSLMGEVVAHYHLRAGSQLGLRWNPGGGPVDLDVLAGRYIDGASKSALTLGVTVRR